MPAPQRPIWKRKQAWAVACAGAAIVLFSPLLRSPRSHASGFSASLSPEDRQVAELRKLSAQGFLSGSPAQILAAHSRHADICTAFGEDAWNAWYGGDEERWLRRCTSIHDELRTALQWLLDNDPEKAVQLSGALTRFWYVRGFPREGYRWLSESLTAAGMKHRTIARARALTGSAWLSPVYDSKAVADCKEAVAIFRERGDTWGVAHAERILGHMYNATLDGTKSMPYYRRALNLYRQLRDERGQAIALLSMSFACKDPRDRIGWEKTKEMAAGESLALYRKMNNRWGISMALDSLAELARLRGERAKSEELSRQALSANSEGDGLTARENLERAHIAEARGDAATVHRFRIGALRIARDQRDLNTAVAAIDSLVNGFSKNPEVEARLLGGELAIWRILGVDSKGRKEQLLRKLRSEMGDKRYALAIDQGLRMPWEQVADEIIAAN